jgi:hypothetical protein
MRKKKTRRSEAKYPALDPHLNLKTRFEFLDMDYLDQLPETWTDPKTGKKWTNAQLKQYLNDFTNEHVHADFTTNKKRIHKKKKVESDKNKDLRELLKTLTEKIKELIGTLNDSRVTTTTKLKLKKTINKLKNQLKKQILGELSYVEDYYKKEAEHKNNARNRCVLTRAKAQGKSLGIDDLSIEYSRTENVEDEMIDRIDELNLMEDLEKSDDSTDNS